MSYVRIDVDLCMFQGLCASAAPSVFEFSDEFGPTVVQPAPVGDDLEAALLAERMCPVRAVGVRRDEKEAEQ